jgi:hypothetical protein
VLRLLAAGKFGKRIATTWWRPARSKARDPRLGQARRRNRTEAAARARQLSLIL